MSYPTCLLAITKGRASILGAAIAAYSMETADGLSQQMRRCLDLYAAISDEAFRRGGMNSKTSEYNVRSVLLHTKHSIDQVVEMFEALDATKGKAQ